MLELIITLILIYCLVQLAGMLKEKKLGMKDRRHARGRKGKRWGKHNNN